MPCEGATTEGMTPQPVASDAANAAAPGQELERGVGASVQSGRAALVYFIGSINKPGGVAVDPAMSPTLLQALALAGGPGRHAALTKVVLIRERDSGRTVTTLNLKRMLRGEDPDLPIHDRDIVFVPSRW